MGVYYEVKQGEHVTRIAMNCGFTDWRPVWTAPENADLRAKRTSPDVLLPGVDSCRACHKPGAANSSCTLCHLYHERGNDRRDMDGRVKRNELSPTPERKP